MGSVLSQVPACGGTVYDPDAKSCRMPLVVESGTCTCNAGKSRHLVSSVYKIGSMHSDGSLIDVMSVSRSGRSVPGSLGHSRHRVRRNVASVAAQKEDPCWTKHRKQACPYQHGGLRVCATFKFSGARCATNRHEVPFVALVPLNARDGRGIRHPHIPRARHHLRSSPWPHQHS